MINGGVHGQTHHAHKKTRKEAHTKTTQQGRGGRGGQRCGVLGAPAGTTATPRGPGGGSTATCVNFKRAA
jgi:hypothetical protein